MRQVTLPTALSLLLAGLWTTPLPAQDRIVDSVHYRLQVETVAEGLEHPWGLAFLPDGRFLVTERDSGRLRIGSADGTLSDPVEGVPAVFRFEGETGRSQAGMFDVEIHPAFAENGLVYLSYSKPSEHGTGTAISRGRFVEENGAARLEDVETIFEMNDDDQDSSGLHFGGRMAFNPQDNTIFLSIGERRNISRSQDPEDQAGSVIRVTEDGSVPDDNPFVGNAEKDDKIYSWGHRNPQGLALNPETGTLWINDHGPRGGDEINRIEAGNNYGWPFITGGTDYSGAPIGVGTEMEGMTSPIHVFEGTVAPSGLAFYTGDMFADWKGDMLHGGMRTEGIVRVRIEDGRVVDEERIEIGRRIRDVKIADDGSIWLLTEHADGEVLRVTAGSG